MNDAPDYLEPEEVLKLVNLISRRLKEKLVRKYSQSRLMVGDTLTVDYALRIDAIPSKKKNRMRKIQFAEIPRPANIGLHSGASL